MLAQVMQSSSIELICHTLMMTEVNCFLSCRWSSSSFCCVLLPACLTPLSPSCEWSAGCIGRSWSTLTCRSCLVPNQHSENWRVGVPWWILGWRQTGSTAYLGGWGGSHYRRRQLWRRKLRWTNLPIGWLGQLPTCQVGFWNLARMWQVGYSWWYPRLNQFPCLRTSVLACWSEALPSWQTLCALVIWRQFLLMLGGGGEF